MENQFDKPLEKIENVNRFYSGGRSAGRSIQSIYYSAITNIPIICNSPNSIERLAKLAKDIGIQMPKPILTTEAIEKLKA